MGRENLSNGRRVLLIYRLGSLGDTVVALPCLNAIRQRYAGYHRVIITNNPVASASPPLMSVLDGGDFVHECIGYDVGTRDPRELFRLTKRVAAVRASVAIYLGGGKGRLSVLRDLSWLKVCGIRKIIGAPLRADLEKGYVKDGIQEPEPERLARCLGALGSIDVHDRSIWALRLTAEEQVLGAKIAADIGSFVTVNTGGKLRIKDWGEANWVELLGRTSTKDIGLVFVGGGEDAERAERLRKLWAGPTFNACGVGTPRETAGILALSRAFIGHDTGPLHLAAAVGTRCLGLYGEANRPARWHPYGDGHVVIHNLEGVQAITVDEVAPRFQLLIQTGCSPRKV